MPKKVMKSKKILYLGLDPSRYVYEGELVHLPIIHTVPRPFQGEIRKAFQVLDRYTHVILTSRTAVSIYCKYAQKSEVIGSKIYLCVGEATAQRLKEMGLEPSYIPGEETAEGVVALLDTLNLKGAHVFFPHSSLARHVIPTYLAGREIKFTALPIYDTLLKKIQMPSLDGFDEIIFTSPSTVEAFFALNPSFSSPEKCLAIGLVTKKVLDQHFSL